MLERPWESSQFNKGLQQVTLPPCCRCCRADLIASMDGSWMSWQPRNRRSSSRNSNNKTTKDPGGRLAGVGV